MLNFNSDILLEFKINHLILFDSTGTFQCLPERLSFLKSYSPKTVQKPKQNSLALDQHEQKSENHMADLLVSIYEGTKGSASTGPIQVVMTMMSKLISAQVHPPPVII